MLDTYQLNLAGLLLACGTLFAVRRGSDAAAPAAVDSKKKDPPKQYVNSYRGSQWAFYVVYALVMGADWLQGPFLYSLYRDEHKLSSSLVSTLFTTGFVSGAASASVSGTLADRHGRRAACLFFCGAYALSCLLTMVPSVPLLFAGRVLGGISTSLLFSVFESWMVTDFHGRFLESKGLNLSRTFGQMSTINSVAAIVSGVFSEWLVASAGTRKAPFAVSVVLLGVAGLFIYGQWDENYGETGAKAKNASGGSKLWSTITSKQVLSLGLASTMFEGSMYLFVFFWGPALSAAHGNSKPDLPYGIIFASFMASMTVSSLLFNQVMSSGSVSYTRLMVGILAVSNVCFFSLVKARSEQTTFWIFCVFEACVGVYWPCMGYLKGKLVDDAVRAQVYGILRVPLNIFVVVSLLLTGDGNAYSQVFYTCSMLLLISTGGLLVASGGQTTV